MKNIRRFFAKLFLILLIIIIMVVFAVFAINRHIVNTEEDNIIYKAGTEDVFMIASDLEKFKNFDADCALVMGAAVNSDGTPKPMLKDRLDTAIALYKKEIVPKILLSGDDEQLEYKETPVMLNYVLEAGVPSKDIFCDHKGFSTYDSMYRAQNIFKVNKIIVVTQTYHEYRSLYIGEKLGMKVAGISSDKNSYVGQSLRNIREIFARNKDFFKLILKWSSGLGGDSMPITRSGISSHGE